MKQINLIKELEFERDGIGYPNCSEYDAGWHDCICKVLEIILKNQTPKQVKITKDKNKPSKYLYYCPKCGRRLPTPGSNNSHGRKNYQYCPTCGCYLDWNTDLKET